MSDQRLAVVPVTITPQPGCPLVGPKHHLGDPR